jgi:hypothetical protein
VVLFFHSDPLPQTLNFLQFQVLRPAQQLHGKLIWITEEHME